MLKEKFENNQQKLSGIETVKILPEMVLQTARAFTGPFRSAFYYLAVNIPGISEMAIRNQPHSQNFLHEKKESQPVNPNETHNVIQEIGTRIFNNGKPEHFIGKELFDKFAQATTFLEHKLSAEIGPGKISEYVFFDNSKQSYFCFFLSENSITPIQINPDFNPETVQPLKIQKEYHPVAGTETQEVKKATDLETTILELMSELGYKTPTGVANADNLQRVNSVCNKFDLLRDVDFEHEGVVIGTLRDNGVHTIGELQTILRLLFNIGFELDNDFSKIKIEKQLLSKAQEIMKLAFPEITPEDSEKLLTRAICERAYFHKVLDQIKGNQQLVTQFLNSDTYQIHSRAFKERHLASIGQTEYAVAQHMLAGYYLLKFEGCTPEESRSQHYMAGIPNYFEDLSKFFENPEITKDTIPPMISYEEMVNAGSFKIEQDNLEHIQNDIKPAIESFDQCFIKAKRQKIRHNIHVQFLGTLKKNGFPISVDKRKGIFPTLIANLAIKRVKKDDGDYQLLSSTWLPSNGGYLLREGQPLPEFNKQVSQANPETQTPESIEQRALKSILYILGIEETDQENETTNFDKFKMQEQRILTEAPVIMEYLSTSERVPEKVRQFMSQISSGEFMFRILETFGSISDQDPNIINRFFPDGLSSFTQSLLYRYVFDYVRGIETNINKEKGLVSNIRSQFFEDWQPVRKDKLTPEIIDQSISTVLSDAEHRLNWLNHETKKIKTPKDLQEMAEIIFGWDTEDMRFLRWAPFWSVWNTLGGAWDCICFSRKTIFNPRAFKAS